MARRIFGRPQRAESPKQAGFVTRVLAFGLDAGILNGIFIVIAGVIALTASFILGDSGHISVGGVAVGAVGWIIAWTVYLLLFWSLSGQTPGMRFLAIAIEADGSRRVGLRRSIRRLVGLALGILSLGLGFLGILFTPRRRGLPDRMADTEVVYVDIERRGAPWSGDRPVPSARAERRRRQTTRLGGSEPPRTASTFSAAIRAIPSRAFVVAEPMWGNKHATRRLEQLGRDVRLGLVDVESRRPDLVRRARPRRAPPSRRAPRGPC